MNWNTVKNRKLVNALLLLESGDEARRFLRDLMTEKEIKELANRFKAAEMLDQKISYSKIEIETGLSSTTIARVAKWLNGSQGGYKAIIKKLHHHGAIPLRRVLP